MFVGVTMQSLQSMDIALWSTIGNSTVFSGYNLCMRLDDVPDQKSCHFQGIEKLIDR